MTTTRLNIEIPINKQFPGLNIDLPNDKNKRYAQQACMSNLLVTVFAVRRLYKSLIINNFKTSNNFIYDMPTSKPAARDVANTAP
jgi:hypothetical protein